MPLLQNFLLLRRDLHHKCLQRKCFSQSRTKMLNSRHNVTKNGKKNKLFISFKHGFLNTQVLAILKIENISLSSSRWSAFVFILISRDTIGECLQQPSCGAKYPGTLQTSHPDGLAPGEHCQRNVCFAKKDTCCFKITTIKIMRCQGFWIYELPPASVNKARYCGNKGKKRVDGYFEHCKNWTCVYKSTFFEVWPEKNIINCFLS